MQVVSSQSMDNHLVHWAGFCWNFLGLIPGFFFLLPMRVNQHTTIDLCDKAPRGYWKRKGTHWWAGWRISLHFPCCICAFTQHLFPAHLLNHLFKHLSNVIFTGKINSIQPPPTSPKIVVFTNLSFVHLHSFLSTFTWKLTGFLYRKCLINTSFWYRSANKQLTMNLKYRSINEGCKEKIISMIRPTCKTILNVVDSGLLNLLQVSDMIHLISQDFEKLN